jgi:aminodeoxyfutalosine deaminase
VESLVARRATETTGEVIDALRKAAPQLQATVAVGDVSNKLAHLEWLADSGLTAVVFHEVLGWDPAKAPAFLADAEARGASVPTRPNVSVRLAAHAPHSNSPGLLQGLLERGGPAAIHLAESPAESQFLSKGDGEWAEFLGRRGLGHVPFRGTGQSPVRYLDSLGVLQHGLVAAHCVHVDAEDASLLARRGVVGVICLTSNRTLGVGVPPVQRLLDAGVILALGTDSLASGGSIDVYDEMLAIRREFPDVEPALILWMATEGGALALGLGQLGALTAGRRPEMLMFRTQGPPPDPWAVVMGGDVRPERVRL